jgi:hypothetical protein
MIGPSSSSSSVAPPTLTSSITATTTTAATTSMRPGKLSMLLWAYAIVDPCDHPPGWEGPRRTERPLMRTSTISPSSHSLSYTSSYEHASDNDNFVTFVEFPTDNDDDDDDVDSFPLSYLSVIRKGRVGRRRKFSKHNNEDDNCGRRALSRKYEDNVGRMFESAALALCRHSGDGVDWSEALLLSSPSLTTTLMRGCSWGELSNIAWSYATRGSCGTPGAASMMMFLANEATSQILSSVADPVRGDGKLANFDAYREFVATAAIVTSSLSTLDQSPKFELDLMAECAHDGNVRARGGRRLRTRRRRIKSTNMYK